MQIILATPSHQCLPYINMNMPQLCYFNPRPATLRWMEEKYRRTKESAKAGKQEWFNKVFANEDTEEKEVRETVLNRNILIPYNSLLKTHGHDQRPFF